RRGRQRGLARPAGPRRAGAPGWPDGRSRESAAPPVSITLVTGPANAGKAQVVMGAVRRHLAHGAEPMLVVPTRTDAEYYLRELAGSEAAVGVRVGVFSGLVDELVRRA